MHKRCIFSLFLKFEFLMRLTTHTDFALRTLMYLASTRKRTTAAEVAQLYKISTHHMSKVVNQLARLGYVRSIRGIGGGIELAQQPEDVRLGDVVETFEGNMHLLDCVATEDVCAIQSFCKLKGVLAEAERLQLEYLNSLTLADVIPTKRQFNRIESTG
ncbi:HTH-type transcriptional repressor NsrR [Symmachiella macrocystis]|uniref:HTH-type transcriptional repressor NsrR n=2 Tax=Symmachiella macrocystis TaxID=2527985 RepID=A0A5C6B5S7_9PLAN|nr:HTH-type transcriptional repressor NsrR [Symmachiella macrocystis]